MDIEWLQGHKGKSYMHKLRGINLVTPDFVEEVKVECWG